MYSRINTRLIIGTHTKVSNSKTKIPQFASKNLRAAEAFFGCDDAGIIADGFTTDPCRCEQNSMLVAYGHPRENNLQRNSCPFLPPPPYGDSKTVARARAQLRL